MVKGAGYTTIYRSPSGFRKYELSAQKTMLRRTVDIDSSRRESLYKKVDNIKEIDKAEFKSERWELYGIGDEYRDYYVLEQLTAADELTGYIKVIPKSRAKVRGLLNKEVEAERRDCMYYKRRTGK